ncbi:MAG: hypothetical protein AAF411_18835 [Myxococcota bacterium]
MGAQRARGEGVNAPGEWLLNLNAERELEGRPPSAALRRRSRERARPLVGLLVPEGHQACFEGDAPLGTARAFAWCATPSAVNAFARVGQTLRAPTFEVLRAVNGRAFATMRFSAGGVRSVYGLEDAEAFPERPLLLKGSLGFAGREQRRVDGPFGQDDRAWVERQLRRGPLRVEAFVAIDSEYGTPGFIEGTSAIIGEPVQQWSERGQWFRSEAARLSDAERTRLRAAAEAVGRALVEAGYFGPFGVDAFRFGDTWREVSEINARYTMGWAQGWPGGRPDV